MATSPWYREGTAKFTQGSTTVTGTGTRWVDFVRAGDGIQGPDGNLYQIMNVASNTSLSISPAYGSETTYWTIPIQGYVKRLADAASQLVRDFEGGAVEALDAADRAKQSATEAKASENKSQSEANRSESEADRANTEADRAQQAADDAVAVVTGGAASLDPAPGHIPIAGTSASIKQAWIENLQFELDALRVAKNKLLYGDGPYPIIDLQFQGAVKLDPSIDFSRASVDWDEHGNMYEIDEPVLTEEGLWLSGNRTNLITYSNDFMHSKYTLVSAVLAQQDGYADLTSNGELGEHSLRLSHQVAVGDTFLFSCELRLFSEETPYARIIFSNATLWGGGNPSLYVNLKTGEIESQHNSVAGAWTRKLADGWYRFSLLAEAFSTGDSNIVISPAAAVGNINHSEGGVSIRHFMGENSTTPTPYIPTDASQVTVAGTYPTVSLGKNSQSDFTLVCGYKRREFWSDASVVTLNDGTLSQNDSMDFRLAPQESLSFRFRINRTNMRTMIAAEKPSAIVAFSQDQQQQLVAIDGQLFPLSGSYIKQPLYNMTLKLGHRGDKNNPLFGFIRFVSFYTQGLDANQLEKVTQ